VSETVVNQRIHVRIKISLCCEQNVQEWRCFQFAHEDCHTRDQSGRRCSSQFLTIPTYAVHVTVGYYTSSVNCRDVQALRVRLLAPFATNALIHSIALRKTRPHGAHPRELSADVASESTPEGFGRSWRTWAFGRTSARSRSKVHWMPNE